MLKHRLLPPVASEEADEVEGISINRLVFSEYRHSIKNLPDLREARFEKSDDAVKYHLYRVQISLICCLIGASAICSILVVVVYLFVCKHVYNLRLCICR